MENALPELEKFEVDEIVELFKTIYQPAVKLVSARIRKHPNKTNNIIVSQWSQRNLERGTTVKILRSLLSDASLKSCIEIDTVDISHWALCELSKSEKYKAVVHTKPNDGPKGETKYYLEIWSEGKSAATFDLTALDLHGAVYTDDYFGSLCWSSQEDKLIYLAEEKQPKTSPFYQQKSMSSSSDDSKEETGRGDQFIYEEDWGEILSPKRQPVIVSCDINKKSIKVLQGVPKDISPAQVICEPNGSGVIGIGFKNTPRRIGVVYCTNRLNHIFYLSEDGDYTVLSDDNLSVLSPKFSPNGKYLIWLQRHCEGPHHGALSLIKYNWVTKEKTVVVDIIQESVLTKNGKEFFGIFCQGFVSRCWTSDSKYVIISTPQKYRINTYAINIDDGTIWDISSKNEEESTILLDISEDDYALFHTTSFKQPSVLSSLHIPSAICNSSDEPLFVRLTKPYDISDKNLIENFVVHNESSKSENSFATYYGPRKETNQSIPLVLYPHGGPHSSVPSSFIPTFDFFTKLGFGVLIVHFHGSSGIGQKYIDSLPGRIGSLDVEDCYAALQTALKKFPWLDPNRVVLFGGSHGGFLVTHLSSQYPSAFIAVVAINPVVNLPTMIFTTDIPDWATVESGYPYEGLANVVNNQELYNKMIEISPITNIRNVKAPTLLLLGKKDLRVPPSQGLAYYYTLKELNIPTKLLFYEDNHSLGTVPVEMDSIINSVIWFQRCLKRIVK